MLTITSNPSTTEVVLIPDVGIGIPAAGGSETFEEPREFRVLSESVDLVTLGSDNAYGVGSHTLVLSDSNGVVSPDSIASYLESLRSSGSPSRPTAKIIASTLVTVGPAAGYAPLTRTYEDGTTHAFTYLADGFSIDTLTETRPGLDPVVYTAVYTAEGIRTHWVVT